MKHIKLFEQFMTDVYAAEPATKPAPTKVPTKPKPKPRPGPIPKKRPFERPEPAKAQAEDVINRLKELEQDDENF